MKALLDLIGDGKNISTTDYYIINGAKGIAVSIRRVQNAQHPLVKEIVKNFDPDKYDAKLAFAYRSKLDCDYQFENIYLPKVIFVNITAPHINMRGEEMNMTFLPMTKYNDVVFECEPLLKPNENKSVVFENCIWSES